MKSKLTLFDCIKEHEGFRSKVYRDVYGNFTIGYGRNVAGLGITEGEARHLLCGDIDRSNAELSEFDWFNKLDRVRRECLIELNFNIGLPDVMKFRKMIDAIKEGDYETAADELLASKWAKQVGEIRSQNMAYRLRVGKY